MRQMYCFLDIRRKIVPSTINTVRLKERSLLKHLFLPPFPPLVFLQRWRSIAHREQFCCLVTLLPDIWPQDQKDWEITHAQKPWSRGDSWCWSKGSQLLWTRISVRDVTNLWRLQVNLSLHERTLGMRLAYMHAWDQGIAHTSRSHGKDRVNGTRLGGLGQGM